MYSIQYYYTYIGRVPPDRDDCSWVDLHASHRSRLLSSQLQCLIIRFHHCVSNGMVVECQINIWFCLSILLYLRMKRVHIIFYNYFTLSVNVRVRAPGARWAQSRLKIIICDVWVVRCCWANTVDTKTVCKWHRHFSAEHRIIIIFILIINLIHHKVHFVSLRVAGRGVFNLIIYYVLFFDHTMIAYSCHVGPILYS